ncbi:MAG TPA: glycosyltransferase [Chthoniobacterales bacterium]|nr:glycosyltransferase [Chthoniobacterales bacterium]
MSHAAEVTNQPNEYIFRFDKPIPQRFFGDSLAVSGWLLHRDGEPIKGIRTLVQRYPFRKRVVKGRRKRSRPDVEAAFPNLPDAKSSGFLLEIPMSLGTNHIRLEVRNSTGSWQVFHIARVTALPLKVLAGFGFPHVRELILQSLTQAYSRDADHSQVSSGELSPSPITPRVVQRVDLFGTSRSNLFILEIAELVAAGFRELGLAAELHLDEPPKSDLTQGTLQIVVTPHEFYNLYLTRHLSEEESRLRSRNAILLCTEQPETGWFQSNLRWAPFAGGMADINALGVATYEALGVPCRHLALGYHPILESVSPKPHCSRGIEIAFLGSLTPRREKFFAEHAHFFSQHRCHLRFVPLHFAKTEVTRSYLSVARRNELLEDTQILLNLHYSEQRYFEWHRMLIGLANGCCIITETCAGYGPLVPGKHFVMVESENLIAACEYYLHRPNECKAIAEQGREFVRTELRQSQMCKVFLHNLQTGREEGLGDPLALPFPTDLKRRSVQLRRHAFKSAIAADFRQLFVGRSSVVQTLLPPPSADLHANLRGKAIAQRDAFRDRLDEQEERRGAGEEIWTLKDNAAYLSGEEPKLSVVITLFNYARFIRDCVGSIERAATAFGEVTEIVIVDDASTDGSLAEATLLQERSTLPVRIVAKRFNTGLADARNVGTQIARAPFVFMMDADNLVYPAAFRELYDTISSSNFAAVYSLLCRFQQAPSRPIGLLSAYDWDPQILVQHPYVDAMALFRRDVLLQLEGYDRKLGQIGWFGWEDYELWLRFAALKLPVGFVPNILCLYRQHETSMLSVTNIFESDLVSHFKSRFATLSEQFSPEATLFGVRRDRVTVPEQAGTEHADT